MTKLHSNQKGFGLLAVLLVVVVVGAVAVVALRVVGNESPNGTASTVKKTASVPATLTTKADVTQAASALDSTNVDSSMNPDQLDSDLNSLL